MTMEEQNGTTPPSESAGSGDDSSGANDRRPRRRGRRGRGGGAPGFRPGQTGPGGFRAPAQGGFRGPPQGGFRGPAQGFRPPPPPARPPREAGPEDEASLQTRELAAYERRQQAQQRRGTGWRPQIAGSGPSYGPAGPSGGGGQWRGGPRSSAPRTFAGGSYGNAIQRVAAGPRTAAPSHDAGEPLAGPHAVLEALRAGRAIRKLYISQDRSLRTGPVNELIAEAQERRIFVNFVDKMEISRLAPVESHQGVVAIVEGRAGVDLDELLLHLDTATDPPFVLVVDSLQDPQNFGVLLRSAEGAGVDGVVIPRHRAVGLTAAVAKTSAGASEHLLVADVANLRQAVDALKEKGLWVVATDDSGDLLYDEVDYRGPTAIVIGGEGEGIRRLVLEGCDQVVRIPMQGRVSSLNAAAAGTVLLFEALRQRLRDVPPSATQTPRPPQAERPVEKKDDSFDFETPGTEPDDDSEEVAETPATDAEMADELEDAITGTDDLDPDQTPPVEVASAEPAAKRATRKTPVRNTAAPRKRVTKKADEP